MSVPFRANFPIINEHDTLVVIFKDHVLQHDMPFIYVKGLCDASVRVDVGSTLLFSGFTPGSPQVLVTGGLVRVDLPTGVFDPLNKVAVLNVLRGRVSVEVVSPREFRAFFHQPTTLSGNTGTRSGGWPTA